MQISLPQDASDEQRFQRERDLAAQRGQYEWEYMPGLPPFVRLRPRPEGRGYAAAAASSMRGDHRPMIVELAEMLARRMGKPS